MTEKRTDIWMPLYVGEYIADTLHLSTEQHGAYLLMLMCAWKSGGRLPVDDESLAAITKLSPATWAKYRAKLLAFFTLDTDAFTHKRIAAEILRATSVSGKRSVVGAAGAESRWGKKTDGMTRSQRLAAARERGTHTTVEWDILRELCGFACVACGALESELQGGKLTKDHINPIFMGGSDAISNIQPTCKNCNSQKGDDTRDHRQVVCPDWKERLAKRLANAGGTPRQSQSHSQTPSAPSGAGAVAPLPPVDNEQTAKAELWGLGKPMFADKGVSEMEAGKFIGKLIADHGVFAVRDKVRAAFHEKPTDLRSWLKAALLGVNRPGKQSKLEAANERHAAEFLEGAT